MTDRMQTVQGRCPACGTTSLFVADGGHVTCSLDTCPNPDAAAQVIGEIAEARQHGAFTFCDQLVGHVSMAAFATKISEKRNAIGQREEAMRYANEQQQQAERAEAAIARVREYAATSDDDGIRTRETILRIVGDWPGPETTPAPAAAATKATERVKHSGPNTAFCVLCLSGEHERVDQERPDA